MRLIRSKILRIMFQLNNLIPVIGLFFCFQITVLAKDHVTSYAREEPLFVNLEFPRGLQEEDLKDLPLTDPKLRTAYAWLIRQAKPYPMIVSKENLEMVAALNDLRRRGDGATPLLLDIMAKNHNTRFEDMIPYFIPWIGTMKMEPYIDYLREMIKTRPDEISAVANEVVSELFLEHGTAEDVRMMQELTKKRPFLAPSLKRAFESYQRGPSTPNKPSVSSPSPSIFSMPPHKPKRDLLSTLIPDNESASSTVWGAVVALIAVLSGLLWVLLKKLKR